VDDATLARIIADYPVLTEACERLVALANERGGRDNITAVLVRIEDSSGWSPGSGEEAR
jgi:protein phosphatase